MSNVKELEIVQLLSKVQFNALKWAYMKLKGGLSEEDAAAKLFADRHVKAGELEALIARREKEARIDLAERALEYGRTKKHVNGSEATPADKRSAVCRYLTKELSQLKDTEGGG